MRLNVTQMAVRVKRSRIVLMRSLKMPDAPKPDDSGKYDVAEVTAHLKRQAALDKSKPTGTYGEELRAKTAAQRALLELELQVKRGTLIERDTAEMHQREFVQVVTSDLLNCPAPLAVLVAEKPAAQCAVVIKDYVIRLLASWKKMGNKEDQNA